MQYRYGHWKDITELVIRKNQTSTCPQKEESGGGGAAGGCGEGLTRESSSHFPFLFVQDSLHGELTVPLSHSSVTFHPHP